MAWSGSAVSWQGEFIIFHCCADSDMQSMSLAWPLCRLRVLAVLCNAMRFDGGLGMLSGATPPNRY